MSIYPNLTPTDLRNAYEVAYGEMGIYHLAGALFANVTTMKINELYEQAIDKVRDDMEKAGQL